MRITERIRAIHRLRARRAARVRQHAAVRDIDTRLVALVAQQLRYETKIEKRSARR